MQDGNACSNSKRGAGAELTVLGRVHQVTGASAQRTRKDKENIFLVERTDFGNCTPRLYHDEGHSDASMGSSQISTLDPKRGAGAALTVLGRVFPMTGASARVIEKGTSHAKTDV